MNELGTWVLDGLADALTYLEDRPHFQAVAGVLVCIVLALLADWVVRTALRRSVGQVTTSCSTRVNGVLCWIDQPANRGLVLHELNCSIYRIFAREGIVMPIPQQEVHLRGSAAQGTSQESAGLPATATGPATRSSGPEKW